MTTAEYQRQYYARRMARKVCMECDSPDLATKTRCGRCAKDHRKRQNERDRNKAKRTI